MKRGIGLTIWGMAAGILAASPLPAMAASLMPHHAAYTVRMISADPQANIQGIDGRYEHRFEHTCEGWVTEERMDMLFHLANGRSFEQLTTASSFEALDGTLYRFTSRNIAGDIVDTYNGKAALNAAGGKGVARYTLPVATEHDLPQGTRFPSDYTAWAIDAAEAGKRMATAYLFDGSEGRGAQRQVVFFGRKRAAGEALDAAMGALGQRPAWPMRAAIYDPENTDGTPQLELEVLQLDNGVMASITLVYPEMTLQLDLDKLEAKAKSDCS